MLAIPQIGFSRSVKKQNVDPVHLADWLEACLLFDDNRVTRADVTDVLLGTEICDEDDMADKIASDGWSELTARKRQGYRDLIEIRPRQLLLSCAWEENVPYAFLVALASLRLFKIDPTEWSTYAEQGDLFEALAVELFGPIFPEWEVYRAGWSPDNPVTVKEIIDQLALRMATENAANLDAWVNEKGNDGGLDIVCYRSFEDDRDAMPTLFVQCASGADWRDKVTTPNAVQWFKWLDASVIPATGIAMPYVVPSIELKRAALTGQAVVLDRLRLLTKWLGTGRAIPAELEAKIVAWIAGFLTVLHRDHISKAT